MNGHSKHRNVSLGYDTSSMMSSELETTSFLESDDDASSRITTTTGPVSNLLIGMFFFANFCFYTKWLDQGILDWNAICNTLE